MKKVQFRFLPVLLIFSINKLDLVPADERQDLCAEITAGLEWQGPVYEISAISGQGTEHLCHDIMTYLESDETL